MKYPNITIIKKDRPKNYNNNKKIIFCENSEIRKISFIFFEKKLNSKNHLITWYKVTSKDYIVK